jgi:hypothetical protein
MLREKRPHCLWSLLPAAIWKSAETGGLKIGWHLVSVFFESFPLNLFFLRLVRRLVQGIDGCGFASLKRARQAV